MSKIKRPLNRSIVRVSIIFMSGMMILLSVVAYQLYTRAMYGRYEREMTAILDYIESYIDLDDMSECARTLEESDKYKEFQAFFDHYIDHFNDVHYLYIMKVDLSEGQQRVYEVCAANSTYEKLYEPEGVMHLGDVETEEDEWYEESMRSRLIEIQNGDEDVFFDNPTIWGRDYTLARPLIDSEGNHFAMLCVDVSIDEINRTVYRNIYINIALIIIPGAIFVILLVWWMRRNVTKPLKRLEDRVVQFANDSTGKRDPDELVFIPPEVHTKNEVESLAKAITKLAADMRDYVKGLVAAEHEVVEMNTIAYRDALTHVQNRASYDEAARYLEEEIAKKGESEFAVVMADLNGLKAVNDQHGHDKGNEYLVGTCTILCELFPRSPVFRIGGDEFVILLRGREYDERDALLKTARETFAKTAANMDSEPWHRYSAAIGMAVYEKGDTFEAVFERADHEMYEAKANLKQNRA